MSKGRYMGNGFKWEFANDHFIIIELKSGKFRLSEHETHQGTAGGGSVLNGEYSTAKNTVRDLEGRIMNFETKDQAKRYADRLASVFRKRIG